jgi:hypothetical protein
MLIKYIRKIPEKYIGTIQRGSISYPDLEFKKIRKKSRDQQNSDPSKTNKRPVVQ